MTTIQETKQDLADNLIASKVGCKLVRCSGSISQFEFCCIFSWFTSYAKNSLSIDSVVKDLNELKKSLIPKNEIEAIKIEKKKLEEENSRMKTELQSLEEDKKLYYNQFHRNVKELNELKSENGSLQEKNDSLVAQNGSLVAENNSLKTRNASLQAQNDSLKAKSVPLEAKNGGITISRSTFKSILNNPKQFTQIDTDNPHLCTYLKVREKPPNYGPDMAMTSSGMTGI